MNWFRNIHLSLLGLICLIFSALPLKQTAQALSTTSPLAAHPIGPLLPTTHGSLKNSILGNIVLSLYTAALKDPHGSARQGAAQSLTGLAQAFGENASALHRYWLPLYLQTEKDPNFTVLRKATKALPTLARLLSKDKDSMRQLLFPIYQRKFNDKDISLLESHSPSFPLLIQTFSEDLDALRKICFPIFLKLMGKSDSKVRESTLKSLYKVAEAYASNTALIEKELIPLFNLALNHTESSYQQIAVESLPILAHALPKEANALHQHWLPLYRKAANHSSLLIHTRAGKSLGGLALAYSKHPSLLQEEIIPLFEEALNSENRDIQRGAAESLAQLALAAKEHTQLINTKVLPLFEQAFIKSPCFAAKSLNGLIKALLLSQEPAPIEQILSFYEKTLFESQFHIAEAAAESLPLLARLILKEKELETDHWFHIFEQSLNSDQSKVRKKAAESMTTIGKVLLKNPVLFKEKWVPLYFQIRNDRDPQFYIKVSTSLEKLVLAASKKPGVVKNHLLPIFDQAFLDENPAVRSGAISSLTGLAEAMHKDSKRVSRKWMSLYQKALNDRYPSNRMQASEHLKGLARAFKGNNEVLQRQILPLYRSALTSQDSAIRRGAAHALGDLALAFSDKTDFLQREVLPLYTASLNDTDFSVRGGAAESLEGLALSIFPHLSSTQSYDLSKVILSHQELQTDPSLIIYLGTSLLIRGYPNKLIHPTETWTKIIYLLPFLKKESDLNLSYFSFIAQHALGRKGEKMNPEMIRESYKRYFKTTTLPAKKNGPKNLIAFILLDFELSKWNLPKEYSEHIRQLRRAPNYREILPILSRLNLPYNSEFRDVIQLFSDWAYNIPNNKKNQYWGTVQKILEYSSRNYDAFKTLGLWEDVLKILTLSKRQNPDQTPRKKLKLIQNSLADLEKLLPLKVGKIFHLDTSNQAIKLNDKELNVLFYIARSPIFRNKNHSLNESLRRYFRLRLAGKSYEEAGKDFRLYSRKLINIPSLRGHVSINKVSRLQQQRMTEWKDLTRHLMELAKTLSDNKNQILLFSILSEAPKLPELEEMKTLLNKVDLWIKESEQVISSSQSELFSTIIFHVNNLKNLILEEQRQSVIKYLNEDESELSESKEVEISIEKHPIEILHLGWPNLGNSCLDIVSGSYQSQASGYLVHPDISIFYIRDPENKDKPLEQDKPLARISVAYDDKKAIFFLVSPIKSSSHFDFQPLVERFLFLLASQYNATAFFPLELYPTPSNTFAALLTKRKLALSSSSTPMYTDLTELLEESWSSEEEGFILKPHSQKSEELELSI